MQEIWKDIEGYEGVYQISNLGNVKSLHKNKELIMKPHKKENGYYQIKLKNKGKVKDETIHRLVAKHFVLNPENKPQVNHIDEDKSNNRADNLEWCTQAYNNIYGTRIEKIKKKLNKPVYQYSLDGKLIRKYKSLKEVAKINNFPTGNISQCCSGQYKQSHGFIWRYVESEVV